MAWVLAFDLDGVIVDSVHECWIVTKAARADMGKQLPDSAEDEFRVGRPFVKFAEDYWNVAELLGKGKLEKMKQEEFNALNDEMKENRKRFAELFYKHRSRLREENLQAWLGLHSPKPGIVEAINSLAKKYEIYVSTARDKASTSDLLKRFAVNIPEDRLATREVAKDKREHMRWIAQRAGVPLERIVFIDDLLEHLEPVSKLGCRVALAPWGYSWKGDVERAKQVGIPVLSLENFEPGIEKLLA